jgi:hypothetical protein
MGAIGTRLSLRPLLEERAERDPKLGRFMSRECEAMLALTFVIARLDRAIQYAAAPQLKHGRLWNTGSPACAGDDTEYMVFVAAAPRNDGGGILGRATAFLATCFRRDDRAAFAPGELAIAKPRIDRIAIAGHSVRAVSLNGRKSRRGYRRIGFCSAATAHLDPAKGAMAIAAASL